MDNPKSGSQSGGKRRKFVTGGLIVLAVALAYFIYENYTYVSTDNAMIQAHTLMLSAKVGGVVKEVLAEENQKVKKGDVLARLDSREYENALKQAEGDVGALQARMRDAETNYKRVSGLLAQGAVSRQQFDSAEASYKDVAKRFAAAEAQVDNARINLAYTEIKAPSDGTVARKSIEVGMVVPPGQALFGFVDGGARWVVANLKETELKDVKPGHRVDVDVDAIPHQSFEGEVESISPSTGATFTLLPPDNATGNFTKVVQRVPVRIKLVHLSEAQVDLLRAGLSADVSIRIR